MTTPQISQEQVMQALATAFSPEYKAQTVGAPVGPYVHGPGGLFSTLGLSQPIISTHTQIISSLAAQLPVRMSQDTTPYAAYITGFVRSDQQEKNAVCDDPEEAGNMKTCIQTAAFGRKEFKTRQVEVNRIGQRVNRGEFMDLNLVNSPLVNQLGGVMMNRFGLSNQQGILAGREMVARIVEVGVAFQRWFCPTTFTGNPGNNSAGGGYKEFPGLDILISTGDKVDAISNQACPSLYSDIKDYLQNDVQDVNAPWNIVHVLTQMYRFLKHKAVTQNMWPAELALVMRSQLFDSIADVWACEYPTYRCQFSAQSGNANAGLSINDFGGVTFRDAMKTGSYLLIDGVKIPVIKDDCITEETAADDANIPAGGYSSDIYFVPLSARGGSVQTMYWELYDYQEGTIPAIQDANATNFFWSDGGQYLWGLKAPDNWCLELIAKTEPRLRLLTPQLAGRLQNVVYTPLQHFDDPLPSQPYHVNGGVPTGYPAPSPYAEW